MKICLVDIDNVVADNFERETKARQFADSRFVYEEGIIPNIVYADAWKKIFYSERAFYKSEWIALDTLIEGAREAMDYLLKEGYLLIYLTSRPESLRIATLTWLGDHDVLHYANVGDIEDIEVIMKVPSFQFVKTTVWKAGMVQTLASLYGARETIFIDDQEETHEALRQATDLEGLTRLWCYTSLKEAVEVLRD